MMLKNYIMNSISTLNAYTVNSPVKKPLLNNNPRQPSVKSVSLSPVCMLLYAEVKGVKVKALFLSRSELSLLISA